MLRSYLSHVYTNCTYWLKVLIGLNDQQDEPDGIDETEHPLLKDRTKFVSYGTSHAKYPQIRTFYHPHAHAGKLKAIADLPLLVVIHGLGGSLPQFAPLLGSLINLAPTFGIELPGHGGSVFSLKTYEAYTFDALTELWKIAINEACEQYGHHKVVLIGHSLGCSIAATLASGKVKLGVEVVGVVAICPRASRPTAQQSKLGRWLLSLPDWVLNILRWFDRRGGLQSNSVERFVGKSAGIDLRRFQLRLNRNFRTPVWKRTTIGLLPDYRVQGQPKNGIVGIEIWEEVKVPLQLIAGEADVVTKVQEARNILAAVRARSSKVAPSDESLTTNTGALSDMNADADDEGYGLQTTSIETKTRHSIAIKMVTLPAPASHALMYDHSTYRTVAGLVEDFLAQYVSHELSLGWQLQQLTTSGKWDVKNLQKWKKVTPVSGPIDGGRFRALKTLREQDEEHTPSVFLQNWAKKIFAIIDISHDSPVYDTKTLEQGGVQYHKFPTVSKIPPTLVEVRDFIGLVDRLRSEIEEKYPNSAEQPAIAVHCHYGYNRTGFFIVCYLIERRGYRVQDAIEEFAQAKPPGIKHDHFIDTLFVRYCVGLRRTSTSK